MDNESVLSKVEGFGSSIRNVVMYFVLPIVVITNTYNILYSGQSDNREDIEYNNNAAVKRISNAIITAQLKQDVKDWKIKYDTDMKLQKMKYEQVLLEKDIEYLKKGFK